MCAVYLILFDQLLHEAGAIIISTLQMKTRVERLGNLLQVTQEAA